MSTLSFSFYRPSFHIATSLVLCNICPTTRSEKNVLSLVQGVALTFYNLLCVPSRRGRLSCPNGLSWPYPGRGRARRARWSCRSDPSGPSLEPARANHARWSCRRDPSSSSPATARRRPGMLSFHVGRKSQNLVSVLVRPDKSSSRTCPFHKTRLFGLARHDRPSSRFDSRQPTIVGYQAHHNTSSQQR